jgi:peptide/nickel transport system substrate-binding protein
MEVETVEWTVFTKKLDERTFDACLLGWGGGVESDPYQIWHSDSIANGGSNHIGFSNAEADRLIVEARGELDVAKRTKLFHQFHQIVHREQPYTFLFSRPELVAVSKNVEGVTVHALGLDSREWWTPAERRRDEE